MHVDIPKVSFIGWPLIDCDQPVAQESVDSSVQYLDFPSGISNKQTTGKCNNETTQDRFFTNFSTLKDTLKFLPYSVQYANLYSSKNEIIKNMIFKLLDIVLLNL